MIPIKLEMITHRFNFSRYNFHYTEDIRFSSFYRNMNVLWTLSEMVEQWLRKN